MAGITKIQKSREEERESQLSSSGLELWLRDGDVAYVHIVPTGNDDKDKRLDDYYTHSVNFTRDDGSTGFANTVCTKASGCPVCSKDESSRPAHKFAFWAYVFFVLHSSQANEDWKPEKSASGVVKYKESVGDFRVFSHGFGKNDYLWNQVVAIHTDNGDLSKYAVTIRRTGSGKSDTSYTISSTAKKVELPKETVEKMAELVPIKDFFMSKAKVNTTADKVKNAPLNEKEDPLDFLAGDDAEETSDEELF